MSDGQDLILELVRKLHRDREQERRFVPGETLVMPSGAALDEDDRAALVEAALNLRIAAGVSATTFERRLSKTLHRRKVHLTNSGSSANLLALTALTQAELGDARLKPGDEVITVAAGFPTTVNPIVQNQMIPVFVDIELGTYNTTAERVAEAISPRTRAIMIAHALGNPFPVAEVAELAKANGLFFVEDNCDAVGSTYQDQLTGTFGDFSTVSFYPAHHLTMGEGGCVTTDSVKLARVVESLRDWGRDCWCEPGQCDTCGKRYTQQFAALPAGYDHKYVFSHVGYNLKSTDLHASLGLSQLQRLPEFGESRRRNWRRLREGLDGVPGLILPSATPGSDPSWFGFIITVAADAGFTRPEIVNFLEARRIGTRMLFAGNLTRQPAYANVGYRVSGSLDNSDVVTERTFWVGVFPGLTDEMIDYVIASIRQFAHDRS
ncbi:lipopolysaccharide biosynthesis protein RfbH [Actinocrispum wychmicini]|uniref:CDP-6-deoxy-D-xylo-4-hexulose-3-dehydrase n=1 Tax=Actinocrispum wychmicini TaxID=1213861 RepID=A0A4R2JRB9_9PSEU|nr:lipopolysaccharide biosynthesis protein RfbH [Actinocrispum wychmicini]TCO62044.1 CDP-6-deoxy-D-xylo-4-hexulose-3-dehydrase [Actinocrispum wychmicini]